MKKILLSVSLLAGLYGITNAQINFGGLPLSMNVNQKLENSNVHSFTNPNNGTIDESFSKAFKVANSVFVDLKFPESGTFFKLDDGSLVWKMNVNIPKSHGMGFYFDKYALPEGVNMFIYNKNNKHILGSFNNQNNQDHLSFSTEAVQGDYATIELNIQPTVSTSQINLHLYKIASYFRGVDELAYYSDNFEDYTKFDFYDDASYKSSSKCGIMAMCDETKGYEYARNATVKEIVPMDDKGGLGYCSGTFVNNTDNSKDNCTKYLLTATHCEAVHAETGNTGLYKEWILKFNYQTPACSWPTAAPVSNSINSVTFVSRDPYNPKGSASLLDADFLLLKTSIIPASYGAVMVGWDRDPKHQLAYVGDKKFVFFHHPAGDVKNFSSSKVITNAAAHYWGVKYERGYGAPGSSGSGMFDADQRIIGIASVADTTSGPDSCDMTPAGLWNTGISDAIWYAKVDYSWDNPSLPSPRNDQKLSPWLDPKGTGAMRTNPLTLSCEPLDGGTSSIINNSFNGDFNIYPNPSNNGYIQLNVKLQDQGQQINIEVLDISGRVVMNKSINNFTNQIIDLDLSNNPNGTYLIKLSNNYGFTTKKVVINK